MPHLNPAQLKNHYLAIRHGQSTANVSHIIYSSLELGKNNGGLTDLGREQSQQAAELLVKTIDPSQTKIYASPFLRTLQTAQIISKKLGLNTHTDPRLVERFYGKYDGHPGRLVYFFSWIFDRFKKRYDLSIDTPQMIANRLTSLILDLEEKYHNQTIILVSHGDPIQVLKTIFAGISPYFHHSADEALPYVQNAEIVRLN